MQFQVPQFLDVEDKIIGPFTIKQFLYLAGGVGLGYLCIRFVPLLGWFLGIGSVALGGALGYLFLARFVPTVLGWLPTGWQNGIGPQDHPAGRLSFWWRSAKLGNGSRHYRHGPGVQPCDVDAAVRDHVDAMLQPQHLDLCFA